jgi:hypothetical protein
MERQRISPNIFTSKDAADAMDAAARTNQNRFT